MSVRHRTRVPGIYYRLDRQGLKRYSVWYRDALGKARTKTLPLGANLEDAKALKADLTRSKLVPTRITMGQLLDEWLERRRGAVAESTMLAYDWGVRRAKQDLGHMAVASVTADTIATLRRHWVREGYKKHTISTIETPLRMALKSAARDGLIQSSPYDKLLHHERVRSDQREMRCLNSEEIQRLLSASSEPYRTLFSTLVFTGLRISEGLSLRWSDVDLTTSLLHVRSGKTSSAKRDVVLMDALCGLLRAWKLKQDPGVELVFPFPYRTVHGALRRAEDAAGLPHYRIHELRHTFASILIAQKLDLNFIAAQLGHSTPNITLETYAHLFDATAQTDAARDRLQEAYGGLV
ncbi:MAG TPA: site-specific integrase [Gemmatimonadales bacterium]|nr:site-specific integrase [Gemmatimonadales bacterium]